MSSKELARARRRELVVFYLLLAMGLYPVRRIADALLRPEPNPATLIYSPHSAYLWRVMWALFAASFGAIVWSVMPIRSARFARRMLWAVLLLGIVQTIWFP